LPSPRRADARTGRHRRRRPPRDVDDLPGARLRLRTRSLLRGDRGGARARRERRAGEARRRAAARAHRGFDFGNSPRELEGEPAAETLILTTTNGTRLLVAAAERFERVYVGSLLNLDAVAPLRARAGRTWPCCAPACSASSPSTTPTAPAASSRRSAASRRTRRAPRSSWRAAFPNAVEGLSASRSAGNLRRHGLEADIERCARENDLAVVPRYVRRVGPAAEVTI
jgi:phosphosulfolactate phosphohydrolase-like enzyme